MEQLKKIINSPLFWATLFCFILFAHGFFHAKTISGNIRYLFSGFIFSMYSITNLSQKKYGIAYLTGLAGFVFSMGFIHSFGGAY